MPAELLILGTSGQAREAAQLARIVDPRAERWAPISYVATSRTEIGQDLVHGAVRYDDAEAIGLTRAVDVVVGIGHPALRRRLAATYRANPLFRFPNLIHPGVEIDPDLVQLGEGNFIAKGVVMTCDIRIGDFNLLNWNVTVGHDARIGSFNVINPGSNISGNVLLGDGCLVGTGVQILEGRSVADRIVVGAGAVVVRDLAVPGSTHVGVPAREVRA